MASLRRSSTKLMSLGSSHRELIVAVSSMRELRSTVTKMVAAQEESATDLQKWSSKEENRAVKDTLERFSELCLLWTEAAKEFTDDLKEMRHHFEMILEGEKAVDAAKEKVEAAEAKEVKLRKEEKKLKKRSNVDTNQLLEIQGKISKTERDKEYAETEAASKVKDHELVKMVRVKAAMKKFCQTQLNLCEKTKIVFSSGNEIIDHIPELTMDNDADILDMKYQSTAKTMNIVMQTKSQLQTRNSPANSAPTINSNLPSSPPPYDEIHRQLPTNPYYTSPEASFNCSNGNSPIYPYLPAQQ